MEMKKDFGAVATVYGKECAEKIGFIKDDKVQYKHIF